MKKSIYSIRKKQGFRVAIKCSGCEKEITRKDLKYTQNGTMYYRVLFGKDGGSPNYKEDKFEAQDGGEFYHENCGRILSLSELKKLGVSY